MRSRTDEREDDIGERSSESVGIRASTGEARLEMGSRVLDLGLVSEDC
jgi:hypothetical protein